MDTMKIVQLLGLPFSSLIFCTCSCSDKSQSSRKQIPPWTDTYKIQKVFKSLQKTSKDFSNFCKSTNPFHQVPSFVVLSSGLPPTKNKINKN